MKEVDRNILDGGMWILNDSAVTCGGFINELGVHESATALRGPTVGGAARGHSLFHPSPGNHGNSLVHTSEGQ